MLRSTLKSLKVMKTQKKVEKKGSRMAGKMEDALSGIY
jgi:hypothetical protein